MKATRSAMEPEVWASELMARDGLVGVDGDGARAIGEALIRVGGKDRDLRAATVMFGRGLRSPETALELGTEILAGLLGVDTVESELSRAHEWLHDAAGSEQEASESLAMVPELLRSKERRLRELRADVTEVSGDLEFANMQWLRERQDAETQLLAYRDRARELKIRLQELERGGPETECPTCERVLSEKHETVVTTIRDEWEAVVQDGSWWRKRRDQLELKPEPLRELEGRSIRLQAAMESCAEEIERLRARLPELAEGSHGEEPGPSEASSRSEDARVRVLKALRVELVEEARELLIARAGRYLNRLTAGEVLALSVEGNRFLLVRDSDATGPSTEQEIALLVLSLRLALFDMCARHGLKVDTLVLGDLVDRISTEAGVRAVVLLRGFLARVSRIVVGCGTEVKKSAPEFFDWIAEVSRVGGHPYLSFESGGVGRLRVH